MNSARLAIAHVSKSFAGVRVLNDVSFEIGPGEVLGLVGENGSGKSTTMNIIAGVLQLDAGQMRLDGEIYEARTRREADAAGIAFIQQELNVFPNLSVTENLLLGRYPRYWSAIPLISKSRAREHARELLARVGLDVSPGTATHALSPGERQLIEIARGLAMNARLMIFDEPTTSLTRREIERLFLIVQELKARGVSIIFISHALEDVLRLADRVVVMRDGHVIQTRDGTGSTTQDLVTAMVGRSIASLFPHRLSQSPPGPVILEVSGVSEPGVVREISFGIRRGEIVGLGGLMGAGRTELARILFGLDSYREGTIRLDGQMLRSGDIAARLRAGVAFLTEDRRHEGLLSEASVADNLALAVLPRFARLAGGRIESRRLDEALQSMIVRLHVKTGALHSTAIRTLSGGNQQKVVLGRWLLRHPALFILDEPTRGVDVGAKQEIYRALVALADAGMSILLISSDLEELTGLADRILIMYRGRLQAEISRHEFDEKAILQAVFGQRAA